MRRVLCRRVLRSGTFLATLLIGVSWLQGASPALSIIMPRGVQRGTETVLSFSGARLADAEEIFFYEPGFVVTKIEPKGANRIDVTVKIADDCVLGEHTAQVRTRSGISEYRTFYVGALPIVDEKEPNSAFDAPQPVAMNTTVHGVVTNEDVDYFVVEAKKGQRISAEIEGMRLGTALFDPYVAILDSKRFELAADDDTPLVRQDAVASIVAPEDGKYIIEVHESAYGGGNSSRYRLHVGTFPRPTAVYPAGGKFGEATEVRFLGDPAGEVVEKVDVPSAAVENYGLFARDAGGVAPSSNPFRPFEHGNVLEKEPNNAVSEATPAELPLAFNGVISEPGDIDCFKFSAKKGQQFEVECYARRIRSALDPVMNLYYANGKSIAGNDDSRGPDSYIRFRVPADGEYVVRVTDHLGSGGADFVYRLEFTPVQPRLTLGIPRVARYSQSRQTIYVARGNRFASLISASRSNFSGELVLEGNDLPQGVKMVARPMAANMTVMPVVFEAAADAPLGGKLIDFTAKLTDETKDIRGGFRNTADLVRGRPGQSIYWRRNVDRLAIAVIEELPFTLEIVQPKAPIVQNGSMQLKIVAHRKEGFDEQITVQFPFRGPGIGAASSIKIPKGKSEALYPITANSKARLETWPIYVIGSANVNGTAWVASQMAELEVAAPFLQFAMQRAACEQGQNTVIVAKIQVNTPFDGPAKVRLIGIPSKVTAAELEIDKDAKELAFEVVTEATVRPGRYRSIFCQVTIMKNGEPIVHRMPSTELRIDKPLPPKPNQPATPKVVVKKDTSKPKPAAPRRLSRLEKLRLEAKERAEAASGQTAPPAAEK